MNKINEIKHELQKLEEIIRKQAFEIEKNRNLLARIYKIRGDIEIYTGYLECPDNVEFDCKGNRLTMTEVPSGLESNMKKINKLKKELWL